MSKDRKIKNFSINAPYQADYSPEDEDLNSRIADVEQRSPHEKSHEEQDVTERVNRLLDEVQRAQNAGVPAPIVALTLEEAAEIQRRKDRLVREAAITMDRSSAMINQIDELLKSKNGNGPGFSVNLKGKPNLKKAIKKAFGVNNADTLTYDMYVTALRVRNELEEDEGHNYVNGNWGNGEEQ